MSITPRPPIPSFLPENAPFSPEQRAWLNGLFAGLYGLTEGVTPLSAQEVAQLVPGVAARRSHEACRRQAATTPHDGGNGAAGLRPVRLQLQGLFSGDLRQKRRAAELVRAGRQGHRPYVEGALSRARDARRCTASRKDCSRAARAAWLFARQSRSRDAGPASPSQQGRLAEGDMAHRARS